MPVQPPNSARAQSCRELLAELRWVRDRARPYRRGIAAYIALGVVAALLGLGAGIASKYLIDGVVGHQNRLILTAASLYAGFGLAGIGLTALTRQISAKLSVRAANDIRAEVFGQFLEIDWQASLHYHSGDLLTRINQDVTSVADSMLGWIPRLITCLVRFFGTLAVILAYDPVMALLALLSAPVTFLMSRFLISNLQHFGRQIRDIQAQLTAFYEESLQNLQAIKAFSLNRKFNGRLEELHELYCTVRLEHDLLAVKTNLLLSGMGFVVSGACFGWCVYRLWSGYISFGTMVLFIQTASMLSSAFSSLVALVPTAISASVAARRIMTILDLPREDLTVSDEARCVMEHAGRHGVSVRAEHLCFSYEQGRHILDDFTLHAEPGEIIGIVSPSGGGKTSFIRAILGLVAPVSGTISLASGGYCAPICPGLRPLITYVSQEKAVFSCTVAEFLRLSSPAASDGELEQALKQACAWEFVSSLPSGLHYRLRERGTGLSEGQIQRLAIARALLSSAPVMLLDEATSALDLATERSVLRNMRSDRSRTVIVTAHRPTVLLSCTRVYSIEKGRALLLSKEEIDALTAQLA